MIAGFEDPTPACFEPAAREGQNEKSCRGARAPPETRVVELIGIEPTTSGLQSPRSPS